MVEETFLLNSVIFCFSGQLNDPAEHGFFED